jgi:hypothetical protein
MQLLDPFLESASLPIFMQERLVSLLPFAPDLILTTNTSFFQRTRRGSSA